MPDEHLPIESASLNILCRLLAGIRVNIYPPYLGVRIALRHHEGDESRTRADVQDALASLCPCPKQHTIRSNLHGASVLMDGELLELKTV